jgi:nitrite reductase/ring-hydroxylating ferredoxin subunit
VVRQGDRVFGYVNTCPHYDRAPLEWKTDGFLNGAGDRIQCASHGALFRIEDGYCEVGPCLGQALQPLALRVEDGEVLLAGPISTAAQGANETRKTQNSGTVAP